VQTYQSVHFVLPWLLFGISPPQAHPLPSNSSQQQQQLCCGLFVSIVHSSCQPSPGRCTQRQQHKSTNAYSLTPLLPPCPPPSRPHCAGCKARYGVVPRGSKRAGSSAIASAWANTYVKTFTCEQCKSNSVPFLPGSKLIVAYNGAKWSIRCEGSSSGGGSGQPKGPLANLPMPALPKPGGSGRPRRVAAGSAAQSSVVLEAASAAAAPATGDGTASAAVLPVDYAPNGAAVSTAAAAAAEGQSAETAAAQAAVEATHAKGRQYAATWYKRGRRRKTYHSGSSSSSSGGSSGSSAPWWPGQCIDCNVVGAKADPTGTYCSKSRQLFLSSRLCGQPKLPGDAFIEMYSTSIADVGTLWMCCLRHSKDVDLPGYQLTVTNSYLRRVCCTCRVHCCVHCQPPVCASGPTPPPPPPGPPVSQMPPLQTFVFVCVAHATSTSHAT
jgi:hypothetical protein